MSPRPPRDLDGPTKLIMQQRWTDHVCRTCGRWHAGGLRRSDGDSRDLLCPRVRAITVTTTGTGPARQVQTTMRFWRDDQYTQRDDDIAFDDVWGMSEFAVEEGKHADDLARAQVAAQAEAERAEQTKAARQQRRT